MEVALNSGYRMPLLIYGTYRVTSDLIPASLSSAFSIGFRHIDTASMYGNEKAIGDYLKSSEYPRSSIFITTKAWPSQYRDLTKACNDSLERLGTDYIDLYLLHWPLSLKSTNTYLPVYNPSPNNFDQLDRYPLYLAWKQMEELQRSGKVRSIGVSNWNTSLLNDMLSYAEIPPACNQIETHLYNPKSRHIQFCHRTGIVPIGYRIVFTPPNEPRYTFKDAPLENELVIRLAEKYGKTRHQILINWNLQRKCATVIKSVTPSRILENWEAKDFNMDEEDVKALNAIEKRGVFSDAYNLFGLEIE